MALALTSSVFTHNSAIPKQYTCQGSDISVPLAWRGLPAGTKSLALIVDDPDAPDPAAPKLTWVHWVLYNIPPTAAGLKEAIKPGELPKGTLEGLNDWKRTGYGGGAPRLGRAVPADRPAPLFPQALRARYRAAGFEAPGQGATRKGDAGPRA